MEPRRSSPHWPSTLTSQAHPERKSTFFDLNFHRGVNWYRGFFPLRSSDVFTLEATPSYMFHPLAAARAKLVVPEARLIALLRDPAERAWSHYRFRRSSGYESRTFAQVIEEELGSTDHGVLGSFKAVAEIPILAAGHYAHQLRPWIELFGRDRILIVDSEPLFSASTGTLQAIQSFLDLRHVDVEFPHLNVSPAALHEAGLLNDIRDYYVESNMELQRITGMTFQWTE